MMQPASGGDPNNHQHQQQQQQQWMHAQQMQQQWMAMHYPQAPSAMAMQQQMLYAQNYMAYHHQPMQQQQPPQHQQPPQQQQQPQQRYQQQQVQNDDNKSVWIGDLHHWMDEGYLHSCFAHTGEVVSVKVIRNKLTGQSEGYGFIEFFSHATAEKVLQGYNGTTMPNVEQPFRLNWASFNMGEKRSDVGSDLAIFVGDLAPDVADNVLQETFSSVYPSVTSAKVVMDPNTGRSKGYGFVRFSDENDRSRALTEMNGMYCSSRPMRISIATPKKQSSYQQQFASQALVLAGGSSANGITPQGSQPDEGNSTNTTLFVGGLDSEVTDEALRQPFDQFGEVVSVKIPVGKGCGFVQFSDRASAEEALQRLNGTVIGRHAVRLSWGRSPVNKQWNGAASYGGQNYNGYGYGLQQNQDAGANSAGAAYLGSSNGYGYPPQQVI